MIDFGLVSLFTVMLALVAAVYHAWRGIKAEISALTAQRAEGAQLSTKLDALTARFDSVTAPSAATLKRLSEVESTAAGYEAKFHTMDGKLLSLGNRISAQARHRPKPVEMEQGPASEDEEVESPQGMASPDSPVYPAQGNALPGGFGKLRRVV